MDPNQETKKQSLADRFREKWFPPAAVIGAFGAFVAAVFRIRPAAKAVQAPAKNTDLTSISFTRPASSAVILAREYRQSAVLGNAASAVPFRRSLEGIAMAAGGNIVALGDDEVRTFDPNGKLTRHWQAPAKASCIGVGPDDRVYMGVSGRVEIFDAGGAHAGGFTAGERDRPAAITAIKIFQNDILVADAAALLIRRYNSQGTQIGLIGTKSKTGKFMLPNKSLDLVVDAKGVVLATDTGRHQVTSWALDGSPLGAFGKFGMSDPADFVGCCNPVNLAVTPDGKVVTAEKMVARVKVFEPDGKLLAVIGPENFDPACIHIYLAVDPQGRILAADPVRREIKIFTQVKKEGRGAEAHE